MKYLMDYLGGARFKKLIIEQHPMSYGAGFFSYVDGFGDSLPVVSALAAKGCLLFRIHLCWKDNHKFTRADLPFVAKEARRLKPIIARHSNVKWYVSPCCEHELSSDEWDAFADIVRRELSGVNYELVNSPNHNKGFVSKTILNEYHGAEKSPRRGSGRYAFSFDGTNIVDSDVELYKDNYEQAEYWGVWSSQMNGNRKIFKAGDKRGEKDFIDRAKRVYFPTAKQLDSWIHLTTNSKSATRIPQGWIMKSHSDQHSITPSGKDQKPVWIIPQKVKEIVIKARNGQVIDTAKYYDRFIGGGHRYYCTQWGYDLANKAKRIQGDALCDIIFEGRKVGVINLAFRDGVYR
ncbi:hypothetical protein EKK58_12000 [Candidatus Dependentiae bacterium]|nr:MAG: hypothetical protein EKK58_12000 [Candidatus Dependentiae bacterium]